MIPYHTIPYDTTTGTTGTTGTKGDVTGVLMQARETTNPKIKSSNPPPPKRTSKLVMPPKPSKPNQPPLK